MTEVDACPFCGGAFVLDDSDHRVRWWRHPAGTAEQRICPAYTTRFEASPDPDLVRIAAWNRRAALTLREPVATSAFVPASEAAYFASIWQLSTHQCNVLEEAFRRACTQSLGASPEADGLTSHQQLVEQTTDPLADREKSAAHPASGSAPEGWNEASLRRIISSLNVTDDELLRIRNEAAMNSDGKVKIWGKMLLLIVENLRAIRSYLPADTAPSGKVEA